MDLLEEFEKKIKEKEIKKSINKGKKEKGEKVESGSRNI